MSQPSQCLPERSRQYAVPYTTKHKTRGYIIVWADDPACAVDNAKEVHARSIRLYRQGQARGVQMRLLVREQPTTYGEPVAVTGLGEDAWAAWRVEALKVG